MSPAAPPLTPPAPPRALPTSLVVLLAAGAGVSAANLYYNQPLLAGMARDLGVSPSSVGLLPTATQVGYAAGLFLFAPLGDRLGLRRVIVAKGVALAAALALAAMAPSVGTLAAASFAIGLLATTAQDYVPAAAALAPPEARGKAVGTAMTGLLLGILLSRVVSGVVGGAFGWRTVYVGAAVAVAALTALARRSLPDIPPSAADGTYGAMLRSMAGLVARFPALRRAALAQGLLSFGFSAFWSTLALVLARPPFHHGSAVAGAFGLAGAAGALVAPLAGSLADKRGPETLVRAGALVAAASFLAMALGAGSLAVLAVATVTFDLGVHSALVSHQTIVYGLDPAARSRSNAVLVSSMFIGMAAGSAIASRVLEPWGGRGIALIAAGASLIALLVRLLPAGPQGVASRRQ